MYYIMNNLINDNIIVNNIKQLESTLIESLPIHVHRSIEQKHNHGPCTFIVPTCSFCMLHGNVFANQSYDLNMVINSHLLQSES